MNDGAVLEQAIGMEVRDIMTADVITVTPALSVEQASKQMRTARIHHLVVVEDHVIGVLSDRDLEGCAGKCVADVMSSHVVAVDADAHVREAAMLMHAYRIGCLPVVDGKRLVGIVTTFDLLAFLSRRDVAPRTRRAGPSPSGTGPTHT
jgi:acetoin utilization protein AcuB